MDNIVRDDESMTAGELIKKLKMVPLDAKVLMNLGYTYDSDRKRESTNFYDIANINSGNNLDGCDLLVLDISDYYNQGNMTVSELIERLKKAQSSARVWVCVGEADYQEDPDDPDSKCYEVEYADIEKVEYDSRRNILKICIPNYDVKKL